MKLCIIIDGYSTGKNYARFLIEVGYIVLHIQSNENLPEFVTREVEENNYTDLFVFTDIDEIISKISQYGVPEFIIPGSDTGVELADFLSLKFDTAKKNNIATSTARRDKFLMGEKIRQHGIKSIKQIKTHNIERAFEWILNEKIHYPLVVKPIKSGSGEGFCLCHNLFDVKLAFEKLLEKKDLFNQINHEVLVQEFISGKEYVVNTISCNGKHFVSDYYLYHKKITEEGHSIYDAIEFLPLDFEHSEILKSYAFSVLDALDIQYGPGHAEIILNDTGPTLVEIGARPAGADLDLKILNKTYQYSQVELSSIAYQNSELYFSLINRIKNTFDNYLLMVFLNPDKNGKIREFNLSKITKLPSYKKVELFRSQGDYVSKAAHLDDAIGVVYLQHKDKNVTQQDHRILQQMESSSYCQLS